MSEHTDTARLKRAIDWGIAMLLLVSSAGFALASRVLPAPNSDFSAIIGALLLVLALLHMPTVTAGVAAIERAVRRWRDRREVAP